ncbi:unnamed protein product [Rhizophagus irregularis]|nr:unnamed protein product [Rhizophagus irregularis]CAB5369914.1 unnamed protein product [Rhizophagus irregularis]
MKMNARKDKQVLCDEYESVAKLCLRRQSSGKYFVRDDDDKETIRINKRRRNQIGTQFKAVTSSEEGLNPPRIDDVSSSQEKIGNLIIVGRTNSAW